MNAKNLKVLSTILFVILIIALGFIPSYTNAQLPNDEEMLKRYDTNGDGKLDANELRNMRQEMGNNMFRGGFDGGRPGGRGFGPMGGPGGGPMGFQQEDLVKKFDSDGDGKLNDSERKSAREYIKNQDRGPRPPIRFQRQTSQEKKFVEIEKTFSYDTKADLYDEKILRTLYFQFPNDDWFDELADFYRTNVEVPADLIVDDVTYRSVGVRFRGNTSYMMAGEKKPMNISIDYEDKNQRLYGYKTLNLLNCNTDPSLVREVLYSRICRNYIPAMKANFVKVVVNGENWGIYANVQQFNKDFVRDWFGTKDGVLWKVPANFSGIGALVWRGPDKANYKNIYELKTTNAPNAWTDLIKLCDVLNNTPKDQLESALKPIFDIDSALWFIALENVFSDSDGYISRGSDYCIYEDNKGRFHLIPYDNNETFTNEGPGPGFRRENPNSTQRSIIDDKNEMRPVITRLLSVPHLRARYIAHVRTIINEWLDWQKLEPILNEYQTLIGEEVKIDDKKQYSYEAFVSNLTQDKNSGNEFDDSPEDFGPPDGPPGNFMPPQGGFGGPPPDNFGPPGGFRGGPGRFGPGGPQAINLKTFIEQRRQFFLDQPEINKAVPTIESVSTIPSDKAFKANEPVKVKAKITGDVKVDSVLLYYVNGENMPFESVPMFDDGAHNDDKAGDRIYGAEIPPYSTGVVCYYVEARAISSSGTTVFAPEKAELGAFKYKISPSVTKGFPVVINEIVASNKKELASSQEKSEDWIELFNNSDKNIDLTGLHITDDPNDLRKWTFPAKTIISAKGYLIIWADKDKNDKIGLHANFKISKKGGEILLVDKDERGNTVLDRVKFDEQKGNSIGRLPDGVGEFKQLTMTPGKSNKL